VDGGPQLGGHPEASDRLQPSSDAEFWIKIGKDSAAQFAQRTRWLYRRVETLELGGDESARRQVSVDFEIPTLPALEGRAAKDTSLVPISVFPKWPPLMGFSLIGADEHPASLYTRATNKRLDLGLVCGMVDLALAHASAVNRELSPGLLASLESLVASDRVEPQQVERVATQLQSELEEKLQTELSADGESGGTSLAHHVAATVDLAAQLSASSVLWVPVVGKPGTDSIVKFSYVEGWQMRLRGWKELRVACSWRPTNLTITLPHAGTRTRFHLDVLAPPGCLRMVSCDVTALPSSGQAGRTEPVMKSLETLAAESRARAVEVPPPVRFPEEYVGAESGRDFLSYGEPVTLASSSDAEARRVVDTEAQRATSARVEGRRAHIYLSAGAAPSHRVFVQIKIRAMRDGFVTGCMLAALVLAGLMTAAFIELESAALHLESTAVLFSLVPAVLGYIVVRPEEAALERIQIRGVRVLALVAGAMPVVGALTLVLTHDAGPDHTTPPDLSVARPIWIGLLVVSWLTAVALIASWRLAAAPHHAE
jgi:hypothetical protein